MLRTLWEGFLDLLYPNATGCIYCGQEKLPGEHELCAGCLGSIELIQEPSCQKCGKPVRVGNTYCRDCLTYMRSFSKALPVGVYRGWFKDAIYAYKFGGRRELAKAFARLMAGRIRMSGKLADCIVPVPLHPERMRQRGFNQAELLGKYLSDFLEIPMRPYVLTRVIDTVPSRTLKREEREINLKEAFAVTNPQLVRNKRILLVDDIYTTGITAESCAKTLLTSGAAEVTVCVLATGIDTSRNL
jgi:competence protein ComFC